MAGTITATEFPAAGMVRVSMDFTAATSAVTATVTRYAADGTAYTVRGGAPYVLSGEVGVLDDFEAPLDLDFYYTAVANTGDTVSTGNLNVSSSDAFSYPTAWFKDPGRPTANVPVQLTGNLEMTYPASGGVMAIIGRARPVAVTGMRGSQRGTVTFATLNPASIGDFRALISTGAVLLLQTPAGYELGNMYCHVGDVREAHPTRVLRHSARYWSCEVTEVDRPVTASQAAFNSWANATATYGTWGTMAAQTWLTVMQGADPNAAGSNTFVDPVYGGTVL
jgi:hypothetical protein